VKPTRQTNYWSIGACISGVVAVLLLVYVAFFKPHGPSLSKEE
jgi:hypothetical protein